MVTPCTYYIIYGRKLYNMIHVWVIYQQKFESRLLTIGLISMHCNGDILRNQSKFQFSSNKIPICLITFIYNLFITFFVLYLVVNTDVRKHVFEIIGGVSTNNLDLLS